MLRRATPAPTAAANRARWLLIGIYALMGAMFASWMARLPAVRDALGLSTAQVGVVLLLGSLGALGAVVVSGAVHARLGSVRLLVVSAVVVSTGYLVIGLGPSLHSMVLLGTGVVLNGIGTALMNLAMNVESGRIERAFGRTVIPQFHAGFSAGAVVGSLLGAVGAALAVPVDVQLGVVALLGLAWRLLSVRAGVVLPDAPVMAAGAVPPPQAPDRTSPWREPRTLLIGVVSMAAALSEGSANNWLSLATVDAFARPEAVGALMLGVFIASMLTLRTLGTRLIDRFGRVRVLQVSGLVALSGLSVFGLAASLPVAAVGVAAWGAGAALAVPVAISAASDEPARAAGRVAVVSSFATVATIVAPPLLGLAAEQLGARHAMLAVTAALLASVLVARRAAPLASRTGELLEPARRSDAAPAARQMAVAP